MPDLDSRYDVIVIGGGIYGAMLAMESQGRGLQTLLLERNDFGASTSFNGLRTIHGGLRYLQSADLVSFFDSVIARRWFLRTFPDLVSPLGCVMPLDGADTRRAGILRPALWLNDLLSCMRNRQLAAKSKIARARIVDAHQLQGLCPTVDMSRFGRAAVWHDATLPDAPRLLIEVLRWARHKGAHVQNYTEVQELIVDSNRVRGIHAREAFSGKSYSIRAPLVINATGPDVPESLATFGIEHRTDWQPSLAWNLLLKRPSLSSHAIAVAAPSGAVYFLHPWKGRCLIGTGHALGTAGAPSMAQVNAMLDDLNGALPDLGLSESDIDRILAGCLPARSGHQMRLTRRPAIVDHGRSGGPAGLISVTGVKFTTSQLVARKVMNGIRPQGNHNETWCDRPAAETAWAVDRSALNDPETPARLQELASREWVCRVEDLVERRTNLWEYGVDAQGCIEAIARSPIFGSGTDRSDRTVHEPGGAGTDEGTVQCEGKGSARI